MCEVSQSQMNLRLGAGGAGGGVGQPPHGEDGGWRVTLVDPCGPQSVWHLQNLGSFGRCVLQQIHVNYRNLKFAE